MATVLVTVTLPTVAADGTTPWPAANYGGADIFRSDNGAPSAQVATIHAPTLTFVDTSVPAPDAASYTASVFDNSTVPQTGPLSDPASLTIPAPAPVPGKPGITAVQTA